MDRTVVIRGLIRILTKADKHDNGVTYEVSLYQDEYDAIEEAIRLLEADETEPVEWIPVSEQMPKEFKTVLVFALSDDGDHGFMTTASHEGRGIWYDECFYQPLPKVFAWMPLPEPYLVKF